MTFEVPSCKHASMPRQVRIEFEGAFYHVMARGDRREAIVEDDEDRKMFLRTLGEAAEKTGFRIHAYVLMSNHYHLLLETPGANLSAGMGWLQNAYTRRINVRHGRWGHVFGGRYKSILAEPGNCFWALMDYVHLNPVRAGLMNEGDGLERYPWSSVGGYLSRPEQRPEWLETASGLEVCGCADTAAGRREFLRMLESRVDWNDPRKAGTTFREGKDKPELSVASSLRRGWVFGSQSFREKMLKVLAPEGKTIKKANGYYGAQLRDHGERRARALLDAGLQVFGMEAETLRKQPKGDWRKALLAAMIQAETTMKLDWMSEELRMGTRAGVCRLAKEAKVRLVRDRKLASLRDRILELSHSNG